MVETSRINEMVTTWLKSGQSSKIDCVQFWFYLHQFEKKLRDLLHYWHASMHIEITLC